MTKTQSETLRRTGSVEIANNRTGFSAYVLNERRAARRRDPDDRLTSAVENVQQHESRLAEGRRLAAEIENKLAKADSERIAELDRMLDRFQSYEARRLISMARANGFEFDLIMQDCCELEAEEKKLLNLLKQYRQTSLGLKSTSNASRAAGFLDDPDPDVRLFARMVANRELLPGEKLDEEEAEPSTAKKKKKPGSREGQEKEFEEAEAGKIDKAGQTGSDDPDADIDEYVRSRGWTK